MSAIYSIRPIVRASASAPDNKPPGDFSKKVAASRKHFEDIRNLNLRRVKEDVKHIANREIEYSKHLLESIFPIKVTVNEQALQDLKDKSPIQVVVVNWNKDPPVDVDSEIIDK